MIVTNDSTFPINVTSLKKDKVESAPVNLLDLDATGLKTFFLGLGEKSFRAQQVFKWIHQRFTDDFSKMTDLGFVLQMEQ